MLTCLKTANAPWARLMQINGEPQGPHRIRARSFNESKSAMFDPSELTDELQELKGDVSRLLSTTRDGVLDASKGRSDALADQIKAAPA